MKNFTVSLSNLVLSHIVALVIGCVIGIGFSGAVHLSKASKESDQVESQIKSDPSNADNWASLGVVKSQAGDREGAISAFSAALKLDPSNTTADLGMGNLYYKDKDFASAQKWYTAALEAAQKHNNSDDISTAQKLLQLAKAKQ